MNSFQPTRLVEELFRHSKRPTSFPAGEVISLASGDPDFETPQHIQQALFDAIRSGATHYAQPLGDPELRDVLAEDLSRRSAGNYESEQVVITHGASAALAAVILACVNPGDKVVIPQPTYSLYADQVRMAGGHPEFVPLDERFHPHLDQLERAMKGARMLALCNPSNPTGAVYGHDEMALIARMAVENGVLVLADEAYDHIVYEGAEHSSALDFPELGDLLIYCQTFSKTHAMTGWRIGYLAAPSEVARAAGRVHFALMGPLNTAVQRAALAAATVQSDHPARMLDEYRKRRDFVVGELSKVEGVDLHPPEGTFYAFLKYSQKISSLEMTQKLLGAGVGVRAGAEFGDGGEGHLRLSFTQDQKTLVEGLRRLKEVLTALDIAF